MRDRHVCENEYERRRGGGEGGGRLFSPSCPTATDEQTYR